MNPATGTQPRITLPRDNPAVQEAERAGVDIDLLEDNLNLTHDERVIKHNRTLALVYKLKLDHLLDADDVVITQDRHGLRIIYCKKDDGDSASPATSALKQ